jgi:predicted permease
MDTWGFGFFDTLIQDFRYAARILWRVPSFTAVALLSLAVGIGASSGIFGVMNALLWKPLPVKDPHLLVMVWPRESSTPHSDFAFYHPMFQNFRDHADMFSGVSSSFNTDRSNLMLDGNASTAIPVSVGLVSGEYFDTMGVRPELGRMFVRDDEPSAPAANSAGGNSPSGSSGGDGSSAASSAAGHSVAVISYDFWQRKFNGATDVLGRTLQINQLLFTIVGVSDRRFRGDWVGHATDVWFPYTMQPALVPGVPVGGRHPLRVFARLKPGSTAPQAQAAASALYQHLLAENIPQYPALPADVIARRWIELQPASGGYAPQREILALPMAVLTALAVVILLAGCANVANLLLARASARQREMAVRAAIGAGQMRIVRQTVTESLLLAVIGGGLGILFASLASGVLAAAVGTGPPNLRNSNTAASSVVALLPSLVGDARVFAFTAVVCVVGGIIFGVFPALRFTRASLTPSLADRGASGGAVRKALVIVQMALSMILLCGAALFLQTLDNLKKQSLGFDRSHLLMAWVDAAQTGRGLQALASLEDQVLREMLSVPGAQSSTMGPLLTGRDAGGGSESLQFEGKEPKAGLTTARAGIAAGFFATVHTRLLTGREFTDHDNASAPSVSMINQTLARFYFGDESPLGKHIGTGNAASEIIGVVEDQKQGTPRDRRGIWYVPYAQQPNQLRATWCIIVRGSGDPRMLASGIRERLRAIDPSMPILDITTVSRQLDNVLSQERLITILATSFAVIATLLACIGMYGVMAYATERRTREFGVRIALGASSGNVRSLVLKDSLVLAIVGIVVGVPLVIAGGRAVSAVLFGVGSADPRAFSIAAVVLMLVAAAAGLIPALRASRIQPTDALRHD